MSQSPLLTAANLSIEFNQQSLVKRLSFAISRGEVVALIGPNGVGKSTLQAVLEHAHAVPGSKELSYALAFDGHIVYHSGITVRRLPQRVVAVQSNQPRSTVEPDSRLGRLAQDFGLDWSVTESDQMSEGESQKFALVDTLAGEPDVLLLDEPTAHLDLDGIVAFESHCQRLVRRGSGLLLISHDRTLIDNLADRTIYLSGTGAVQSDGGYTSVMREADARYRRQAQRAKITQSRIDRLQDEARKRFSWSARKEKSKRGAGNEKPHIAKQAAKMARRAQSVRKKLDRETAALAEAKPLVPKRLTFRMPTFDVANRIVLRAEDVSFAYDVTSGTPIRPLLHHQYLNLSTRDRICLIGGNGCGKSTLIKILLGELQPTSRSFYRNRNVRLAYVPQGLASFFPHEDLLANFPGNKKQVETARQLLGELGLRGDSIDRPVSAFSQGELMRAAVVRCFMEKAEFIFLDEPTSHLDLETIQVLEDALHQYKGGYMIVSHDRSFVTEVASDVMVLTDCVLRSL